MVEQNSEDAKNIEKNFKLLRKCRGMFECLLCEMLFIKDLKRSLNKQSDSIYALKTIYLTFYISITVRLVLFYCLFNCLFIQFACLIVLIMLIN